MNTFGRRRVAACQGLGRAARSDLHGGPFLPKLRGSRDGDCQRRYAAIATTRGFVRSQQHGGYDTTARRRLAAVIVRQRRRTCRWSVLDGRGEVARTDAHGGRRSSRAVLIARCPTCEDRRQSQGSRASVSMAGEKHHDDRAASGRRLQGVLRRLTSHPGSQEVLDWWACLILEPPPRRSAKGSRHDLRAICARYGADADLNGVADRTVPIDTRGGRPARHSGAN